MALTITTDLTIINKTTLSGSNIIYWFSSIIVGDDYFIESYNKIISR